MIYSSQALRILRVTLRGRVRPSTNRPSMVSRCMSASLLGEPSPAQRWFALAIEDLAAARVLIAEGSVALRIAGFLAQQAAEKALKAGLFAA